MSCPHSQREENEDGFTVCSECGYVFQGMSFNEEYSQVFGDGTERCHRITTKKRDTNPYDEYNIANHSVTEEAYEIYKKVASSHCRCTRRKGLLAACLYSVLKNRGELTPPGEIAKLFKIKTNVVHESLIEVDKVIPTKILNREEYSLLYVKSLLENFKGLKYIPSEETVRELINKIYKDDDMSGIRPQNVTAAAICYCMERTGFKIKRKKFAEKVGITEALLAAPMKRLSDKVY